MHYTIVIVKYTVIIVLFIGNFKEISDIKKNTLKIIWNGQRLKKSLSIFLIGVSGTRGWHNQKNDGHQS